LSTTSDHIVLKQKEKLIYWWRAWSGFDTRRWYV